MEKFDKVTIGNIASVCHDANASFCRTLGDTSQPNWDDAPTWQKDSAIAGVAAHLNGSLTPEQSHESWMKQKREDGWVFGLKKDPTLKTHPCMVPYNELPLEQQMKDYLFRGIVHGIVHAFKEVIEKD